MNNITTTEKDIKAITKKAYYLTGQHELTNSTGYYSLYAEGVELCAVDISKTDDENTGKARFCVYISPSQDVICDEEGEWDNTENLKRTSLVALLKDIIARYRTKFKMGINAVFDTHGADSELDSYSEQVVSVIRPLTFEEADLDDVGPMYKIRFNDGKETDAFEDELTFISADAAIP